MQCARSVQVLVSVCGVEQGNPWQQLVRGDKDRAAMAVVAMELGRDQNDAPGTDRRGKEGDSEEELTER